MHSIEAAEDAHWMGQALVAARAAAAAGEVPVGAVVVKDGKLLAAGANAPVARHDPTAHAEIVALRAAAQLLGNYRLDGCTLYVTLEPCAMCSGAMLHARLDRVVYGAADPKTGTAGSVLDLFGEPLLNHRTHCTPGVRAHECGALLQAFFANRRDAARQSAQPLRDNALRTPDTCFASQAGPLLAPHYVADLPSLDGLRLHYADAGPGAGDDTAIGAGAAPPAFVCLHASRGSSADLRALVAALAGQGARALAPDLIGYGRSDKPKKAAPYPVGWHAEVLAEWLERLGLQCVVLVAEGNAAALADAVAGLAGGRVSGRLALGQGAASEDAHAFPDRGHRAMLPALHGGFGAVHAPIDPRHRCAWAQRGADGWSLGAAPTISPGWTASDAPALARCAVEYFAARG